MSAFINGLILFVHEAQRIPRHGLHDVFVAQHAADDAAVAVDKVAPARRSADNVLFRVQHHAVLIETAERIALVVEDLPVADDAAERAAVKRHDGAPLHQTSQIFPSFIAHDTVEIDTADVVHAAVLHAAFGVQIADGFASRPDGGARRNDQTDQRTVIVDHAPVKRHTRDVFAVFKDFARVHAQHARVLAAGGSQNIRIHHAVTDDGVHFVRHGFVGQEFTDRAALRMHDVAAHGNASQKFVRGR